jgi:hypothetical protein
MKKFAVIAALVVAVAAAFIFALWTPKQDYEDLSDAAIAGESSPANNSNEAELQVIAPADSRLPAKPGEFELLVKVVNGADGMPVQDAKISFYSSEYEHELVANVAGKEAILNSGLQFSEPVTAMSNAQGKATFEWNKKVAGVGAHTESTNSDFALTNQIQDGVLRLELKPSLGLAVQVVDAQGQAMADIPIVIDMRIDDLLGTTIDKVTTQAQLTREEDGKALFYGLMAQDPNDPTQYFHYVPRIAIPGVAAIPDSISPDRFISDVLAVSLEHFGPLQVKTVDQAGAIVPLRGHIRLHSTIGFEPVELTEILADGTATFDNVGLETEMKATVLAPFHNMEWSQVVGPFRAGERPVVEMRVPEHARLAGRLLFDNGKPASKAKAYLSLCDSNGPVSASISFWSDDSGKFKMQLPSTTLSYNTYEVIIETFASSIKYQTSLSAIPIAENTLTDLGDVVLAVSKDGIRGRCVDPEGNPITDTILEATAANGETCWIRVGKDGTFWSEGFPGQEVMLSTMIEVGGSWVFAEPVVARQDGEPMEIVLYKGSTIVGQIIPLEGDSFDSFKLRIFKTDGLAEPRYAGFGQIESASGKFSLPNLPPGIYRVQVRQEEHGIWANIDDISVEMGQETADPRLNPLDLATQSHLAQLIVEDEFGLPLPHVTVDVFQNRERMAGQVFSDEPIRISYLFPEECTLCLTSEGYQPVFLPGTTSVKKVVMKSGFSVTIDCLNKPILRRDNERISLSLHLVVEDKFPNLGLGTTVDLDFNDSSRCTVTVPGPGIYRLERRLHNKASVSGILDRYSGSLLSNELINIEVTVSEKDEGGTVFLRMPADLFPATKDKEELKF